MFPQKAASTQDGITELEGYISRLNRMVETKLAPMGYDGCPQKLRDRLQSMARYAHSYRDEDDH